MLHEEMVNTLGPSGLTIELVPLHSLSLILNYCSAAESGGLNNEEREVREAQ